MKWIFFAILIFKVQVHAQVFSLTLEQAEERAFKNSSTLKGAQASVDVASSQAQVSKSVLWPRLSLEAFYFYQSNVPEKDMGPIGTVPFGTHDNYAIGPMLSYTLFDGGKDHKTYDSFKALSEARKADYQARVAQFRLNLRVSYYRVLLASKALLLITDSLKLALAQSHDIDLRFRAGTASRLDQISAHKDQLSYQLRFNQAQTNLGRALRDLLSLVGEDEKWDTSRPIPSELLRKTPSVVEPPSLVVQLDSTEKILQVVVKKEKATLAQNHPELVSLEKTAQASRSAVQSAEGGYWPKIQIYAKSQLIYPNVVIPEQTQQNIFGVALNLPLFEGTLTPKQSSQRRSEALVADLQREQKRRDFIRDWNKIRDGLINLKRQQKINQQNVAESKKIERLTYESYRSGRVRFLDVQSANFRLLEAQVNAVEIDHQILEQTASLEYLSSKVEEVQ